MRMSRRSFAVGGAGAALYASLNRASAQNAPAPLTRFDVATPQGEAMLEKYARGVAKMMDIAQTPQRHPRSWLFQWYTHAVDPDRSVESEIARIYGGAPPNDPQRLLALSTWNTCQPHGANGLQQDPRMFLPWHRMYLYHFERIIRAILPDDTFTLPYWDYTTPGQRAIPRQFRMPNDPLYKVLFRENRNRGQNDRARVNDGEPIDRDRPNSPLNLSVLAKGRYERVGADLGFNETLDGNLHGQIHVLVGDVSNMGDVPTAARDPIFWLHHCNVDRLWAAWNKGGRPNPGGTFLTQSFAFGDGQGVHATSTVRDFVDTERIPAGPYRYDKLPSLPPAAAATVDENVVFDAAPVAIAQQTQPGAVRLAANVAVPVPLSPIAVPMSAQLEGGSQRVFLVLQDVQATTQPNVLYDVFLDAPSGAPASTPVGTVNFFGATHSHGGHGSMANMGRTFSFDVSDALAATGAATPTVRIAPDGAAIGNSSPTVGRVSLIRQ